MSNIKKSLNMARKIKKARKEAGLSQKQLASRLAVTDKAVSSYEVGRATPPVEVLREISKYTFKPVQYFVDEKDSEKIDLESRLMKIEKELTEAKKILEKLKKA
jgi:transcriptional regulator with XRE-family HTH domain